MKAKSAGLKLKRPMGNGASKKTRMSGSERREQILSQASEFFSEYGLTGQTRSLAVRCGISQRLLYRFFPTKSALLAEVYARTVLGPFKGDWFADLADRSKPVEERLIRFYLEYFRTVLTRRWLRLFLYSSLAEADMAPNYISAIITRLMETIVTETAVEQGVELPEDRALVHELGWTLHGAVSHLAIRKHLYHASRDVPEADIIRIHVGAFVGGFKAMVGAARRR